MPQSTDDDPAPSRGGGGGPSEAGRRSVAATTPPPPPVGASSAAPNTTSSITGAPSMGVENHPSPDSAPVPVAQTSDAYEMEENCNKKEGVEEIVSSDDDAPVPVGMMDTSYDQAEKGSLGKKSVELVGGDDEGPVPPAQLAAEDGSEAMAKTTAATTPLPRTCVAAPGDVGRGRMMPAVRPPPPSMLPAAAAAHERAEPSVPAFHEVHATLVEDEPEQPVYDAVPVGEEHWAKRHQKKIAGGVALVFVALVVALGVAFGTDDGDVGEDADATVIFATTPPTRSLSPSSPPTRSLSPSNQPSMYPRPCFADKEELKAAVDDYTAGGIPCFAGDSECEVVQQYGWPIGTWCTSYVTDMSYLFQYKFTFNDDLSSWDTSKVTSMEQMFQGAYSFDQDVNSFDTSKVTSMELMFEGAYAFNGDVSNWDTSKVTSMEGMFDGADAFNGDVSNWDTSKVTTMGRLFAYARSFNQDVSGWDVASVTFMREMFEGASAFNQNLCAWGVYYNAEKDEWGDDPYYSMFLGTSCPNQNDPTGPDTNWCAATCNSG